ncbi:non-hydrolyzing UDP-N-acetylglucosamine 2-epimerase [Shewanella sp. UCD-KL12]|uniref:non-hydrolyzing UDP-N-acetylglucosamine 2-epimerase n=1 Tax=Shewanella sp. UCD-KL12 TaxID=1917163 RepID=UPI00097069B0|nr:UDP-N-acetylglucosamine 2-epimerase (non-hydrolyzing) [Shewanella sp. UCD-KL12]
MIIMTIVGARPQFIKAATVSRAIKEHNKQHPEDSIREVIVHTGQHYDINMSDIFFEEMDIPKPSYSLGIGGGTHGAMTGQQLEQIEKVIFEVEPDLVLVYGDTNSTLAGALAASKLHINVAHVEAGLRSFNMKMPEEQNRILTDRLSSVLFCPTNSALENLKREGFDHFPISQQLVGDVMYDAAQFYTPRAAKPKGLEKIDLSAGFILSTIHRAENTDDKAKLAELVSALNELHLTTPVIMPLHPRTKNKLNEFGLELNIHLIDPIGYLEMVYLLDRCSFVASDSGGVQKEAYFFDKHCLILREETEWVELVETGANFIVGSDKSLLLQKADELCRDILPTSCFGKTFYGDGNAADKIVKSLVSSRK